MAVNMRRLAAAGARVRLQELEQEKRDLFRKFPELRARNPAPARRRRWRPSAAQRKAISDRMTRYWAGRRKKK